MLTGNLVSSAHAEAGDRSGTATRLLHDGNSYAASGFCAWGIQGRSRRAGAYSSTAVCTPHSLRWHCGPRRLVSSQMPGLQFCLFATEASGMGGPIGEALPAIATFAMKSSALTGN